MSSAETPRTVALGFFEDINAGRSEDAFARLAPDVRYELMSPSPNGGMFDREGLGRFVADKIAPRLAGPMAIDVLGVTASDDRVAIETSIHAHARVGGAYVNRFPFLFVVRNGLIAVREYLVSATFIAFVEG
ncbi:nuclear transport factor 2 family protein [Novosphingobium sp.]|uniref:nuclear transport factor 2 family protein n=1 Tax=Novosphingobium sp. TaxID=1874826 RepID=UPI0031D5887F